MDGVYSCCDRTDSEVIQDILLYEFRKFHRPTINVILGPVFDNEKENWRILTTKEKYAIFKNPTVRSSGSKYIRHEPCVQVIMLLVLSTLLYYNKHT